MIGELGLMRTCQACLAAKRRRRQAKAKAAAKAKFGDNGGVRRTVPAELKDLHQKTEDGSLPICWDHNLAGGSNEKVESQPPKCRKECMPAHSANAPVIASRTAESAHGRAPARARLTKLSD